MAWDCQVNNLYSDILSFLETHTVSELLDIVRFAVEEKEEEKG